MPDQGIVTRRVVWSGIAILMLVMLVPLSVVALLKHWALPLRGGSGAPLDAAIAGARLEEAPQPALEKYLAEKRKILSSYGWVDAQHARIPVDEAMQLLAQRSTVKPTDAKAKP